MDIQITEDTFGFYTDPTEEEATKQLIRRFTMANQSGMKVQVINYGAAITSIQVPGGTNKLVDVVLGFDNIDGYVGATNPYFGATVGRVANRIAKAKFSLNGQEYTLAANNGENNLHGGKRGFDKRIWESDVKGNTVTFSYSSRDGEEGYPGELLAKVTFELTSMNELVLKYQATTTKPTPICLTNHSYFNLSGAEKANEKLKDHFVQLNADNYTPVDNTLITIGEIKPVENSVYDFRTYKNLHDLLESFPPGQNGYDNNFCVNQKVTEEMNLVASAKSTASNIKLEVFSDQPGLQLYTSNFFPDPANNETPILGKNKASYFKHGGFCLETQNFPNAINQPKFPNAVLNPGEIYQHNTIFRFSTLQ